MIKYYFKAILSIAILCVCVADETSAQYIVNQFDSTQTANFNISGNGRSKSFRAMQTTAPSGNVHFAIEQTPGQLRWGLGTYTADGGITTEFHTSYQS